MSQQLLYNQRTSTLRLVDPTCNRCTNTIPTASPMIVHEHAYYHPDCATQDAWDNGAWTICSTMHSISLEA